MKKAKPTKCKALNAEGERCRSQNIQKGDTLCRDHLEMVLAGKEVKDWDGDPFSVDFAKQQKRRRRSLGIRRMFGWFFTNIGLSQADVVIGVIAALAAIITLILALWPKDQSIVSNEPTATVTPTISPTPIPTVTPLAGIPAASDEFVVVIARFDGDDGYHIQRNVHDEIRTKVTELNIANVRVIEGREVILPDQEDLVQQVGDAYNATAVIWGWIDKSGFTPNFTITRTPHLFPLLRLQAEGTLPEEKFQTYVREELPAQMAYFVAWTVSQILFWTGQTDEAAVILDTALEEARQGNTTLGLEHVYLYRGIIEQEFRHNPEQAIIEYSHGIEVSPDWGVLYTNRGAVYADTYHYRDALKDYDQAIEKGVPAYAYNNRCIVYMNLNDYEQALEDCNQAIALQQNTPDVSSPYLNRGSVYAQLGDFENAEKDYQSSIDHNPQNADAYSAMADLYEQHLGNVNQAIAWYKQALALDPSLSKAHTRLGKIYEDQGDQQRALQEYEQAIASDPEDTVAYRARAAIYADADRIDEAFADYIQLLLIEPWADVAWDLCQRLDRCEEAVSYLQGLVREQESKNEDTRQVHVALGQLYDYNDELDKTLREFSIALTQKPTSEVYRYRAAVHLRAQNPQAAVADYSEAIRLEPDYDYDYVQRAEIYEELGDLDKALADRTMAVKLDPRGSFDYVGLYELCERMQACERVVADLTAESTTASFDPDTYLVLAQLHEKMGNLEKAIDYCSDYLELDEDDMWVREKRAGLYEQAGDLDEAIEDYTFVLLHRPRATQIYKARGDVYRQQGEYELAFDDYNEAVTIDPTDWWTLLARAGLYDQVGDTTSATTDYVALASTDTDVTLFRVDMLIGYCQEHGTYQQAIEELSTIADESSTPKASVHYSRARLYEETNQLHEAVQDYTVLIEELGFSDALYHRGFIYKDLGETDLALADLKNYLEADLTSSRRAEVQQAIAELTQ